MPVIWIQSWVVSFDTRTILCKCQARPRYQPGQSFGDEPILRRSESQEIRKRLRLELQLPGLADEVVTETVMFFLGNFAEAGTFVDVTSRVKDAVRRKRELSLILDPSVCAYGVFSFSVRRFA